MSEQVGLGSLLRYAELQVIEFDVHRRTEMRTFNRTLPWYVMSYLKTGSAKLRIGEDVFTLLPGMVICIPPGVKHDHYKEAADETEFLWWHFTYEIEGVMDVMKMIRIPYAFQLQNYVYFEKVFMEFIESSSNPDRSLPLSILKQAKSLELLYLILDSAVGANEDHAENGRLNNFIDLLTRIVQSPEESLTLQRMSDELHLNPTYISNRFKELFGKSPMQLQREMKIQRAKTLLETSEMTVTELSGKLGFSEVQNFTRLFKSYVGISPSQFRSVNRKWRVLK